MKTNFERFEIEEAAREIYTYTIILYDCIRYNKRALQKGFSCMHREKTGWTQKSFDHIITITITINII